MKTIYKPKYCACGCRKLRLSTVLQDARKGIDHLSLLFGLRIQQEGAPLVMGATDYSIPRDVRNVIDRLSLLLGLCIRQEGAHLAQVFVMTKLLLEKKAIHPAKQRTPWAQFYCYSPLLYSDSIRLLEIQPGQKGAGIICTVVSQRLGQVQGRSRNAYEALSYTWGDSSSVELIECVNGELGCSIRAEEGDGLGKWLSVTKSCASALRRLRLEDQPRRVWVDAICINQKSIDERNSQVRLMARIYSTASRALVYLGEASNKTTLALEDILNRYRKGFLNATELLVPERMDSLQVLLSQPWFRRTWVLQEVYMANNAVALFGSHAIDWDLLVTMTKQAAIAVWDFIPIQLPHALLIKDDKICAKNLFDLLCSTRHCLATDPRDKLFALLSIVEDADTNNLAADYSKETPEVFTKLAIHLLEHIGLEFLIAVEGSVGCGCLPSWVPDWSISSNLGYLPPSHKITKRAGGPRNQSIFTLNENARQEPNPDEMLADFILENYALDTEQFASVVENKIEWALLPSAQNSNTIGSTSGKIPADSSSFEYTDHAVEHRGASEAWSNFKAKEGLYLNSIPTDWSIVIRQYCDNLPGIQSSDELYNDLFQLPVLTVRGINVDRIEVITPVCNFCAGNWLDVICEWHTILQSKPTDPDANDKFYRVITWDALESYEPFSDHERDYNEGEQSLRTQFEDKSDLPGFKTAVQLAIDNRRLYFTANGNIGLCPAETKIGDAICIFLGAVYPCVLRKISFNSGYSLVGGSCYLDGAMNSKAFSNIRNLKDFIIW